MFKRVDPKQNFPEMEEEVLKFWEKNEVFKKSVENNSGDKPFIFYEGPPSANGTPGLHHVLARAFKDIIPRYKTMKGYRVERKAGWDTHGLPVEIQVEKDLKIRSKTEIENIVPGKPRESIIEFNKKCEESAWKYKDEWERLTQRMAYWVDMKNPYITYENRYIESVWWIFAQIYKAQISQKCLVYKGHKVLPYCYRCGTALSSHEVAQGYQTVKDNSVFIKFKTLTNDERIKTNGNEYLLVWTTTPWTLPGNVALAVNNSIKYQVLSINGDKDKYIVAKDRVSNVFKDKEYEIISEFKGKNLLGKKYEPPYKISEEKNAYKIISGNFVSTEEGTGIVHIAPAFGADDAEAAKENNLPTLVTVNEQGIITADVPGKGIPVKKKDDKGNYKADQLIVEDLKKRGLLFKEELYEHEYPYCWRCDTPLIYYAKPSWFIRMSELRDELSKNNENINWIPENIKNGRFGEWLRDAKDWAISRERYWGTPLPIWECNSKNQNCENIKVIESIKELEKLSGDTLDDYHKPFIDEIKFKCDKCGGNMKRVPEVMDVWFDSGSMPLAQYNYPNQASAEDKKKIESGKYFPADYISEAIDQTRGWFYTLHAIATLLNISKKVPTGFAYKNVICLGHILDAKGKKMSKSRGNVVDPMDVMNKFGADILRWHLFTINQPGLYKRFDIKNLEEVRNRVFRMLWNSYSFFILYANIDKFEVKCQMSNVKCNLLDKWIISELNVLIKNVNGKLEKYDIYGSANDIEKYIDNLSNWYIRRSRKRFWKSENDKDKNEAYQTLYTVLVNLSKLMAPFTPFVAEEIYKNLTGEKSVHLANFPVALDEKFIDEKLNIQMRNVRDIINVGLEIRATEKKKVRQPLAFLKTNCQDIKIFEDIIKDELNVKEIHFVKRVDPNEANLVVRDLYSEPNESTAVVDITKQVAINTKITEDLRLEGQAREIIRYIQEMRKEAGYEVDNRIKVFYDCMSEVFDRKELNAMIKREILADKLSSERIDKPDLEREFKIEGEKVKISIKK